MCSNVRLLPPVAGPGFGAGYCSVCTQASLAMARVHTGHWPGLGFGCRR